MKIEKTEGYRIEGAFFETRAQALRFARRRVFEKYGQIKSGRAFIPDVGIELLLDNYDELMKELQSLE